MPRTVTPITALPDDVVAALLKAANSQAIDVAANGDVSDAKDALTAAQAAVTTAQNAEATAHAQATSDTNAAEQSFMGWLQGLATPVTPPVTNPPPASEEAPPAGSDPNAQ